MHFEQIKIVFNQSCRKLPKIQNLSAWWKKTAEKLVIDCGQNCQFLIKSTDKTNLNFVGLRYKYLKQCGMCESNRPSMLIHKRHYFKKSLFGKYAVLHPRGDDIYPEGLICRNYFISYKYFTSTSINK